jgi:hypothetical protein
MKTETWQPYLVARGRLTWSAIRSLVGDRTCAWGDLDGFHVGAVPDSAPSYSHFWSWQDTENGHETWLLRARIDGDEAIVGLLQSAEPEYEAERVDVTIRRAESWGSDQRIPIHILHETSDLHPIVFVSLRPARG